jgi:hypothetical protein
MSGANLDGYAIPRDGIHKTEMLKRIDKLEDDVDALKSVLYELITFIENLVNKDEDTEALRSSDTTD